MALEGISRSLKEPGKPTQVLFQDLHLTLDPGERLALFSTTNRETAHLLRCVAGVDPPDRGRVRQNGSVAWPVGTDGTFSNKLSGYENVRFALAIYGQPGWLARDLALIQALSGLDRDRLHDPLSTYSGGQKTRLAMAIPLALRFDLYPVAKLPGIDVATPSPEAEVLLDRLQGELADAALLLAGNDLWEVAQVVCHEGVVLINGRIAYRGDLEVCRLMVQEQRERLRQEQRLALLAASDVGAGLEQPAEDTEVGNDRWESLA